MNGRQLGLPTSLTIVDHLFPPFLCLQYFPGGAVDVGPYARSVLVTSVACLVVGLGIVVAAFVAFPVSWDALSVAHVGLLGMVLVGLVSCVVGLIGMTSIRDDQGVAARQHLALSYCGCLVALFLLAVALAVVFLLSATDFVSQGLVFSEHLGAFLSLTLVEWLLLKGALVP